MKIGVIGAGNWGKNLVKNLHELGVLGGVAEASPALREAVAKQYPNVPVYDDERKLLATDVAGVAIATPVPTHHVIGRQALLAGKDVFIEKPIAFSVPEATDLVALARAEDRVLMVGHLLLYQPAVQWIKECLDSGKLGTLKSLHQERLNLGKARAAENALWSLGVHDLAVLLYLTGQKPSQVGASGQRALQSSIEDDVYVHLKFPSGAHAHLHSSWLWPERRRRLTVIGTEGMLVYDEETQNVVLHRKGIQPDLKNRDEGSEIAFSGSGEPLKLEMEHFICRIKDRNKPLSDGVSGLEVVRVIEQAMQALRASG